MTAAKTISKYLVPSSDRAAAITVWTLRVLVGAVFIFSGWVKAVDIWGGSYKIGEYAAVWGITLPESILALCAGILAMAEFVAGAMIALGCFRRMAVRLTAAFMAAMTLLTLYLWISDPVKDCGCFGDAVILSNAATFWKNIAIDILLVILWLNNHRAGTLVHTRLQWLAAIATAAYAGYIEYTGYDIQPVADFRGYALGQALAAAGDTDAGIRLVYAKDGQEQAFAPDSLPDEDCGWEYVRRESADDIDGGITFLSVDGDDVTADVIADEGPQAILLVPDPAHYGRTRSAMANELYDALEAQGGDMFAVVGTDGDAAATWADKVRAHYPVYTADDTDIKMLARGSGALVYLRDGRIIWKQTTQSLPPDLGISVMKDGAAILDNPAAIDALRLGTKTRHATTYYLLVLAFLMASGFAPALRRLIAKQGAKRQPQQPRQDN